MKTFAFIPIRSGSKRFPNKNFSEFCDKSLITNTIQKLINADIKEIFISTDTPHTVFENITMNPIELITKSFNKHISYQGVNIIERPKELAEDNSTTEEVVNHFIKKIDISEDYIIVLCQVTSPNWKSFRLKQALHILKERNQPVISVSPDFQPSGCFYIFKKTHFLQYQSIYTSDIFLIKIPWEESNDIDYLYQLRIAEAIKRGDYI